MKIFVGHSFADRDEELVNAILSFLGKKGISYQTGEKAQNQSVSEKVKLRIDDNEVFLGVFTIDEEIKQQEERNKLEQSFEILSNVVAWNFNPADFLGVSRRYFAL